MFQLKMFTVPVGFRGRNILIVQAWWFVQATLFAMSPQFMYKWRVFLLRIFGAKVGRGCIIRPSVKVTYPWKLSIGDYSWLGDEVTLYTLGNITIGNNSVISQKSYLCTGSHDYTKQTFDIFHKSIVVGDSCWLATDVYVAPGVNIVDKVIVAARSSVFKEIREPGVYIGCPAAKIN